MRRIGRKWSNESQQEKNFNCLREDKEKLEKEMFFGFENLAVTSE